MNTGKDRNEPLLQDASANPGYALGQLAKALATSQSHEDPEVRERASRKIEKWVTVFEGMLSGALRVGSRTPVEGTPAWATLEVAHGGFSTGTLLAEGDLQPHEQERLLKLSTDSSLAPRAVCNSYYLTDVGLAELRAMLLTGRYRIRIPEEGALLVVAWLLEHGNPDQARLVLDHIGPFLTRLRFYPIPDARPLPTGSHVRLQTIGQTIQDLKKLRVSKRVQAQREAVLVWATQSDRVVELFLETVEGDVPSLELGPTGKPIRTAEGGFAIRGGWPCQIYTADWNARAQAVLAETRKLRKENRLCGKVERTKKSTFAALWHYLEICATNSKTLTGKDVGRIRLLLAGIARKRGIPDSERCKELRRDQVRLAKLPTNAELAKVVISRLGPISQEEGLDSLDQVLMPVTQDEANEHRMQAGQSLSNRLGGKVSRCLTAPVDELIELGIITSGEVLARVIPQITAQVRAAGIADPELRQLYGAIYQAFRRRRSLLLLNLESQVKLEELPWVQAINGYRQDGLDAKTQAGRTLEQVVVQAIKAFPHQILPNKLLQEIRSLSDGAGLKLPIVDEVAADIFMGTFSEKFLYAAQRAGELLEGSLYERYYGIPYAHIRQIDDVKASQYGTPTSPAFIRLCTQLAFESSSDNRWSVARNGKIIEQEQVVTTHNLAVLFDALGLRQELQMELPNLARRCFQWICRRLQQKSTTWKARLQSVKNAAYAWRQLVFFLALSSGDQVEQFQLWAMDHLGKQTTEFQLRFKPALEGLSLAVQGSALPPVQDQYAGARRFLGWTTEKHWLLSGGQGQP